MSLTFVRSDVASVRLLTHKSIEQKTEHSGIAVKPS